MTLDHIIQTYGTHELDVSFCINNSTLCTISAYCHQHDIDGQFIVNHYLKITGKFTVLAIDVDDETDIYIHTAFIEKASDGTYEIHGVGGYVHFSVDSDLLVERSEKAFT